QLSIEVNIDAVIAGRPTVVRPRKSKRAVSVRTVRDCRSFVDEVLGWRDLGDVLRDPDNPDFRSERQIVPLPSGVDFRCLGGELIARGASRSFSGRDGNFLRRRK